MSHCLICEGKPEFTNDALLVHIENAHGYVDLTEPVALRRTRRARLVVVATGAAALALLGVLAAVYLGALVRIFDLTAGL